MLSTGPIVQQKQASGLMIPRKGTGGVELALDHPQQPAFPSNSTAWSGVQGCRLPVQGLLPLGGEEPPGAPPGAPADRAAGGRVGAKTRK